MHSLIKVCKSLSDETRLRVLNLLLEKECCVCEVMQTLGISQTRASRNLNILREAGFLKLKKEGLWSLYSIDKEEMEDYLSDLINVVSKALDGNEVLILDKNRLNKAKRVGPTHITSL